MAASARSRFGDALRHRDLRLLVAAFLVDGLGSWAYVSVLIVYVFDRTHSTTWIAATSAARWVPGLLLASYGGVLADRYERTRVMVISALLSAATMLGLAVVVATGGPIPALLALCALAAVFAAPYRPAAGAVIPDVVGERELVAANALFSALESSVVVVGPAVGALLLLTGAPVSAFVLNAASFVVAALLLARLRARSRGGAGSAGEGAVRQFVDGVQALGRQRVAAVLVAFCGLDSAIYGAASVLYVPISRHLGTGNNGYGYLLAGSALGGVLAAGLANRLSGWPRLAPVILAGIVVQAVPFALVVLVHNAGLGFVLQVVSGIGMIVVDVLAITALQRDIPRDLLSRVLSLLDVAVLGATVVASFVFAAVVATAGLQVSLVVIGVGFPVLALVGLPPLLLADRRAAAVVRALAPKITLLQVLDLFAAADRPTLERVAAALEDVELGPDTVVLREGDPADALWIIVDGEVEVTARGEGTRARRLRTVGPRNYVGEIGLLHRIPRTATVRTVEPTRFWRLPGDAFLDAVEGASASASLLQTSVRRLSRSHPGLAAPATPDAPPPPQRRPESPPLGTPSP